MAARGGKGLGCLWAALAMAVILAIAGGFLIWGIVSMTSGGSFDMPVAFREYGVDENPQLREVWSCGSGDTKVSVVSFKGIIMLDEGDDLFSSSGSADTALRSIRRATHDRKVKALILDIDSGGGGITACDVIHQALKDFKAAQPDRKIVAVYGDVAASGAYYISMAADYIIARPTTVTGSIGVLMQTYNVRGLGEKLGIHDVTIKSGKNKDMLNPFGELSDEQRTMLQGIVDSMQERFVSLVAEGRRLPVETVRPLADGRIFVSTEALKLGLVDELGHWEDAVRASSRLLGVSDVRVYRYEKEFSLSDMFKAAGHWKPRALLGNLTSPRLLYLWQP